MRAYTSEFIGTFTLVLFGCGSMVAANFLVAAMGFMLPLGITTLISAITFGVTMAIMYYTFSKISGCHLNPAVSLAVLLDGGFKKKIDFLGYIVAQFLGASLAMCIIWMITGQTSTLAQTGYDALSPLYLSMIPVVIIELIISFIFVLVFMSVRGNETIREHGGFVIGMALTAIYAFGIPFTGGGANPARSFGPAIFALGDAIKQYPIFLIVPLVGAVLAFLVYKMVIKGETLKKVKKAAKEVAKEENTESESEIEISEEIFEDEISKEVSESEEKISEEIPTEEKNK